MRLRLLAATCVVAALIGACQREPLAPGQPPTGTAGGTGIGGRAQDPVPTGAEGGAVGGAVTGGAGSGGAGVGGTGSGGAAGDGGGAGGAGSGAGGTAGAGEPINCAVPLDNGQPCTAIGSVCFNVRCVPCSDQYWRSESGRLCVCLPTGVWDCGPRIPINGSVDCFFDPPLSCAIAQGLYEDPTCQTHPACEPAN